jgi:hypothetical protein
VEASEFVTSVLLPLATGGTLTVHAPIDADDLASLQKEQAHMAGIAELAQVRRASVAHLLRDAPAPALDEATLRLGAAIHNLCWLLAHPGHDAARGALARVVTYTEHLCALPAPSDDFALVARHTLVGRLRGLTRRDVRVRFWAGAREFRGQEPPRRLLRWQGLRRVRQEHSTVELFTDALAAAPTRAIVVALLGASPLTDLLGLERSDPPVDLRTGARWLRSPRVARALADEYLRRGLTAIEPPLTAALMALYNAKGAVQEAATATAFHSHLHLLELLGRPARDREGHLQVLRGYTQGRERALADGFGLFAAADRVGLGRPLDLGRDRALERNVDAYAEACAELVGSRRLLELVGLVARGAGDRARVS